MTKLPVGIQLYSLRDFAEKDFKGTLKAVKDMGYDCVEFAGLYDNSPKAVKEMCTEIGLTPISAHVAIGDIMKNVDGVLSDYMNIGCKFIVIPWAEESVNLPGGSEYDKFISDIKTVSTACKKYGLTLLYHNHDFEFHKIDGKYKLDILYSETTPDELQTQIDTCWVSVGGENPAEYVMKYAGRAPLVHIKDYVGSKAENMYGLIGKGNGEIAPSKTAFELRPVGYGIQDVAAIIKASEDAGAVAVIVEQDRPSMDKDPMECAKMSIDYIRSL